MNGPVPRTAAIVGAGPAGLMVAEQLAAQGVSVTVYDRMPSPGRKFLMAGRGGLNLTHSEDTALLATRYGAASANVERALSVWSQTDTVAWANGLGIETFVGSSGRVFPTGMKASPLLRAWLRRLDALGVRLQTGHEWRGFDRDGALIFATSADGESCVQSDVVVLALGGASWPRLGSNGAWLDRLSREGVPVSPWVASNCGVRVAWSDHLAERHAGAPLKRIAITVGGRTMRGEAILTRTGLEGGAVYALGPDIRAELSAHGRAELSLDLRPDMTREELGRRLSAARGKQSTATFLKRALKLTPAALALMHEAKLLPAEGMALAQRIKAVPITAIGTAGLDRAISSAGGVAFEGMDEAGMLKARPGVFVAGEMLDWDAPTGGYLLQATFSTAVLAAHGARAWLDRSST